MYTGKFLTFYDLTLFDLFLTFLTFSFDFLENLLVIEIPIPDGIAQCGDPEEDDDDKTFSFAYANYQNNYNYSDNITDFYGGYDNDYDDDEDEQLYIKLQPFSIFFLLFYIILIVTQFICMLWHR